MSSDTAMLIVSIIAVAITAANVVLVFISQRRVDPAIVRELSQQLRELAEKTQTHADDMLLDIIDQLLERLQPRDDNDAAG